MKCGAAHCTNDATNEGRCPAHQLGDWKTETTRDWRDERDIVVRWRAIQKRPSSYAAELGERGNFLPHGAVFWHRLRRLFNDQPRGSEEYQEGYHAAVVEMLGWAEEAADREIARRVGNQRVYDLVDSLHK